MVVEKFAPPANPFAVTVAFDKMLPLPPLVHRPGLLARQPNPASQQPWLTLADGHEQYVLVDAQAPSGTTSVRVMTLMGNGVTGVLGRGPRPSVEVGTHSDAPQASETGQHALTGPNKHVGWPTAQASAQSPTPLDEMHAAPDGQQPLPSAQGVCVDAWQMGVSLRARSAAGGAAGAGVIMGWRPA